VQHYTLTDDHPFTGTSFYRIKQVDVDGNASYSKISMVTLSKSTLNALTIYPTVTRDAFTVRIQNKGIGHSAMVRIVSADGKLIQKQTVFLHEGENKISYSLAGAAPGVYYIRVMNGDSKTSYMASVIKN
jgi:hypothetical protein